MTSSSKIKYGLVWETADDAAIELEMIRCWGYKEYKGRRYGLGMAHHVIAFQKIVWPWKYWHRWNEGLIVPELCKPGRLAIWGPSSTGKSQEAMDFGLTMFYARPKGTTILASSTELDSLDRRIWGYCMAQHKKAKAIVDWLPGHTIESKRMLLADPKHVEERSKKDGIIGVACKKGNQWQGLSSYIGLKNEVVILLSDENQFMPSGFWDSAANLESNPITFIVALGNMNETTSSLGKAAEPELGWDSLPDSEKSRVYPTRWSGGRAIQLVGKDSPNLDYPTGKEPYRGLIGSTYIKKQERNYGIDTPLFNMFVSGKIPRNSSERRVITRSLALKFRAMEDVIWGDEEPTKLYMLDAAYSAIGGDRTPGCGLGFGKDIRGEWKIGLLERPKIYTGSPDKTLSHEDFIALTAKAECIRLDIPPEHCFYDGTGRSSLTSSFARLWSPLVVPIEFGGAATERPNFQGIKFIEGPDEGQLKPCNKVFGKFVTELWFAVEAAIQANQMRGLTEDIVEEGCMRIWKDIPGGKKDVEPKDETRERMGRSPDLFDMLAAGLEGARRLGFPLGRLAELAPARKLNPWLKDRIKTIRVNLREKELSYN